MVDVTEESNLVNEGDGNGVELCLFQRKFTTI